MAAPSDYEWMERLIEAYERADEDGEERALVRLCLGAPQRAAAHGVRTITLMDDVHLVERLDGDVALGAEMAHTTGTPAVRHLCRLSKLLRPLTITL